MADYRETHVWYDGRGWSIYTERPADARKAERLFGPPEARASTAKGARQVWNWRNLAADVFRWGRKRRAGSRVVPAPFPPKTRSLTVLPEAEGASAGRASPRKRARAARGGAE
jgi:hypothetical protein